MNSKKYLVIGSLCFLVLPTTTLAAATYVPLIGIPGLDPNDLDFNDYINALYALSISVGALIAVIKIIIAGMKYMLSDVVTNKSEAIKDIQGAIFGLIIVISAVLILQVINPNITSFNTKIQQTSPTPGTGPAATTPGVSGGIPQPKALTCTPIEKPAVGEEVAPTIDYDCDPARAQCKSEKGVPNEYTYSTASGLLSCEYGKSQLFYSCTTDANPNCTGAINKCLALPGGSPYIIPATLTSSMKVQCITPF